MMDLHQGLSRIAGSAGDPTTDQIEADLARGRRALRRRRTLQAGGGSAFAVAAVAAAVVFATAGPPTTATPPPLAQGTSSAGTTAPAEATSTIKLVGYTGEQPEGYTLDKVPSGWEIQGVDAYVLTLAPENARNKDLDVFEGKVVVMLQSVDDNSTPAGDKVDVGGNPGVITKAEGQTTGWTLYADLPSGPRLVVQVWDGLGWDKADVVEFAQGIHVNADAKPGHG